MIDSLGLDTKYAVKLLAIYNYTRWQAQKGYN